MFFLCDNPLYWNNSSMTVSYTHLDVYKRQVNKVILKNLSIQKSKPSLSIKDNNSTIISDRSKLILLISNILKAINFTIVNNRIIVPEAFSVRKRWLIEISDLHCGFVGVDFHAKASSLWFFWLWVIISSEN